MTKNSPFPSYYEDVNYVYIHEHPETKEIVYVGHGTNERAWRCTSFKDSETPIYGHRKREHSQWCQKLIQAGYVPSDWVHIMHRNLSKEDAKSFERGLINKINPKFNSRLGEKILKFTPEVYDRASKMREDGLSYSKIAKEIGLSTMVVHRGLNKGSPCLERLLNER